MQSIRRFLTTKETIETLTIVDEATKEFQKIDQFKPIVPIDVRFNHTGVIGKDVLRDLEAIVPYEEGGDTLIGTFLQNTLYGALPLAGTRTYIEAIISNPICDVEILNKRQEVIKAIKKAWTHDKMLADVREYEQDLKWIFSDGNTDLSSLYDMVYVNGWVINQLNKNDAALTAYNLYRIIGSPLIGILSPIAYIILPYLVLRIKFKIAIPFKTYVRTIITSFFVMDSFAFASPTLNLLNRLKYISYGLTLLFYFQGLFNSVEVSHAAYKITKMLTERVNGIVTFIKSANTIVSDVWTESIPSAFDLDHDVDLQGPLPSNVPYFKDTRFDARCGFTLLSNFGQQLCVFKSLRKEAYIPLIKRIYVLDALRRVAHTDMCYPVFISESERPVLILDGFKHPCLDKTTTVPNDVQFDACPGIILTGPNAGGKSTAIKSIIIAALLSQTFGICNAEQCKITPFKYISTQINVPDAKGTMSLFEAEMYRSKSNFEMIKTLGKNEHALIAMDEIFSSTNPVEGISGAYSVAKHIMQSGKVACILSTHFVYLARLAKEGGGNLFRTKKMEVITDEQGRVVKYPFKLKNGVSRQYIALELLKKNGFDDEVIQDALAIKNSLCVKKPVKKHLKDTSTPLDKE